MFKNFKFVGVSHQTAPVQVREKMYLPESDCKKMLSEIASVLDLEELLILSTCNRTEVYFNHKKDVSQEIIKLLRVYKGIPDTAEYASYFEIVTDHLEACKHLFEVSMGLRSGVVGDLQISNQAKNAYAWSSDLKLAGPFLHRLMHTIFHTNKRVQQETQYRQGAASVSYASAELARDLVMYHQEPSVLVIGMGEMGKDVARHLSGDRFKRLAVSNRTLSKATLLADEISAEVIPFETVIDHYNDFDVIISTVEVTEPIITLDSFASGKAFHNKFVIDLSMPRSVDEAIENIPGIVLYNIDEINEKTSEALEERLAAIPKVKEIIQEQLVAFDSWSSELSISPTINKLKEALDNIRKEELARVLNSVTEKEADLLNKVTSGMVNKIIKLPVLQLKAACKRGEQETLIGLLNDLFDLSADPVKEKS